MKNCFKSNNMNTTVHKIIILGDSNTGKTSIIKQYKNHTFLDERPTIGVDFETLTTTFNNREIKIHTWDVSGKEYFRFVVKNYLKITNKAIFVFDLSYKQSFQNTHLWIDEFVKCHDSVKIFLVGNKCDLNRQVSLVDVEDLIRKYNGLHIDYFEISAKDNINIDDLFNKVIQTLCETEPNIISHKSPLLNVYRRPPTCFEKFKRWLSDSGDA